jgi:xanthine dehydrogenase YagR molybdenum-binding subunit
MAQSERTEWDPTRGYPVTLNLADYLVPVHAVPEITAEFSDHPDLEFNFLDVRGMGEIGIAGIAAATVNVVCNATGVRALPIAIDWLLA